MNTLGAQEYAHNARLAKAYRDGTCGDETVWKDSANYLKDTSSPMQI